MICLKASQAKFSLLLLAHCAGERRTMDRQHPARITTKSNSNPQRPHVQAHQNKVAFRHNKASKKSAQIMSLPNEGVCPKCHDIIEWRKKYRKYKPLKVPNKCQICEQKTVTRAYHVICSPCSQRTGTCAKCREQKTILNPVITAEQRKADLEVVTVAFSKMTEGERRTFLRQLKQVHGFIPGSANDENVEADDGADDNYEEEEIDFVKAAAFLRNKDKFLGGAKASTQAGSDDGDDDSDAKSDGEGPGSQKSKLAKQNGLSLAKHANRTFSTKEKPPSSGAQHHNATHKITDQKQTISGDDSSELDDDVDEEDFEDDEFIVVGK